MIPEVNFYFMEFKQFILAALEEDIREGDHSTMACISVSAQGQAILKIKEAGCLAGVEIAEQIFRILDPNCRFIASKKDGDDVLKGETAFTIETNIHTILKAERLVLNIMQRMSGIATLTQQYVRQLQGYSCQLLDTRKTTPNFRWFEKAAVRIGGGYNHRMGLYDMIMLKDNHIDYCGGIAAAITKTKSYLAEKQLNLAIEVEARSLKDVDEILFTGGIQRIMLDNFDPETLREAVIRINKQYETEASGGITLESIRSFADTGVDFISCGAIIHHAVSMDLSLKAVILPS